MLQLAVLGYNELDQQFAQGATAVRKSIDKYCRGRGGQKTVKMDRAESRDKRWRRNPVELGRA